MVLVLVSIGVIAFVAFGQGGGPSAGSASSDPSAVRTTPTEGALKPGTYRTDEFEPAFTFAVGKGWSTDGPELPDALSILLTSTQSLAQPSRLGFYKPTSVIDRDDPSWQTLESAPESAEGWVKWFQEHPNLDTSKLGPVTVGHIAGKQIDVVPSSVPKDYPRECGDTPCALLYPFGEVDANASFVGYHDRFIVLEVDGEVTVIDIGAPADDFEDFSSKAQEVLDTVEWKSES